MTFTYLGTELRRSFRNPRYVFFTIDVPVVLFLVIGNAFKGDVFGVSAQTWYMVNMAVFGAIGAVLGVGARIADERDSGWNRQLRLTPLPPLGYVAGKVMTGMLVALPALVLVCLAGRLTGAVQLGATQWAEVIGLGWVAILPMAVVGVGLGYFSSGDNAQAVNGGVIMLMSMFGGIWFPIDATSPDWLRVTASVLALRRESRGGGRGRHCEARRQLPPRAAGTPPALAGAAPALAPPAPRRRMGSRIGEGGKGRRAAGAVGVEGGGAPAGC